MKFITYIIALSFSVNLLGQELLTLEDAKVITLDNNFGIQIARNNVNIAMNSTEKKANGYLPTVIATGGPNGTFGQSSQSFNNNTEANTNNALSLVGVSSC